MIKKLILSGLILFLSFAGILYPDGEDNDEYEFDPEHPPVYHVDPEKEYKDYFKSRYGTPEKRPNLQIIEQRCIEDMRRYFAVSEKLNEEYCLEVAELWRKYGTRKSLADMRKAARICFLLSPGCNREFSRYSDDYINKFSVLNSGLDSIWQEVSLAWHEIKFGKESTETKEETRILIKGMSTAPDFCYAPYALEQLIGRLKDKASIRDAFYAQLFAPSFRKDWYCGALLFKLDSHGKANPLFPTEKELIRMWESESKNLRILARKFFSSYYPSNSYGQKRVLEGLNSIDYLKVKKTGIGELTKYFENLKDFKRKEELYTILEGRLQALRAQQDKGKYFSASEDLKQIKGGIPVLISWYLTCMKTRCPEFRKTKIKDLEDHLVWLENIARQLNDDYLLRGAKTNRVFLDKLKEESQ